MNISMPTMTFMTKYYHSSTRRSISVLNTLFKILPVFVAMFSLASCEEDPTTMGKGLLPGSDFVDINHSHNYI
jgi:hypothetical protein